MNEDFYQVPIVPAIWSGIAVLNGIAWATVANGMATFPEFAADAPTELAETVVWILVAS